MTMTQEQADEAFAEQKQVLASAVCHLELGFAFTMSGSVQVARIFKEESYETKGGSWKTRKVAVGPMLVAPTDNNTRAALLRQLADILELE